MTVESKSSVIPALATTLTEAASAFRDSTPKRPKAAAVVSALLEAEKAAKQQKLTYPLESLLGSWRLCFVTTAKAKEQSGIVRGRGWYLPKVFIKAHISFNQPAEMLVENPGAAAIANQLEVGAFTLKLTGPALYLGKKNLLAFDFYQMQLSLFGRVIYSGNFRKGQAQEGDFYQRSIGELAFFSFFMVAEDFIAARGRGGGLALWIRDN